MKARNRVLFSKHRAQSGSNAGLVSKSYSQRTAFVIYIAFSTLAQLYNMPVVGSRLVWSDVWDWLSCNRKSTSHW